MKKKINVINTKNHKSNDNLNNNDLFVSKKIIYAPKEKEIQILSDGNILYSKGVMFKLGAQFIKKRNYLAAVKIYKELVNSSDPDINLLNNLTDAIFNVGDFEDALFYAQQAYELAPNNLLSIKNYLSCLLALGKADVIKIVCETSLLIFPNDFDLKFSLASCKRTLGETNEAIEILKELHLKTNDIKYKISLIEIYGDKNSFLAIKEYSSISSKVYKSKVSFKFAMSLHYLRIRNFDLGWEYFEYGLDKEIGSNGRKLPYNLVNTFRADKYPADNLTDVLICSEQGIGDQLTFLSAMNDCIKDFSNLYMICEPRMYTIINRSFPSLKLSTNGKFGNTNLIDPNYKKKLGYIPLGSILPLYRKNLSSFTSNKKPFISPNAYMCDQYKKLLSSIALGRNIIGISWKSNVPNHIKNIKEIEFIDWISLFDKNTLIVNLQYGDTSYEQNFVQSLGLEMVSFRNLDFTIDLEDWLAITASCHGIISISTSLSHFAGSIGQNICIVMPGMQGHWSLGIDEAESIFYSNAKIIRKNNEFETGSSLLIRALEILTQKN